MQQPSSLAQGLKLLQVAADRERSGRLVYTASGLADATALERSRVSRLTQELRTLGHLERGDGLLLRVGHRFLSVAAAAQPPWLRRARAELRMLTADQRCSAGIAAADGVTAVLVRSERISESVGDAVHAGMVTPIWCTALGRALLWDHTEHELAALLERVSFVGVGGPNAVRSVDALHRLQRRDRAAGVIAAHGEFDTDRDEYAVPLRDTGGRVIAAVGVDGVDLARQQPDMRRALLAARDNIQRLLDEDSVRST